MNSLQRYVGSFRTWLFPRAKQLSPNATTRVYGFFIVKYSVGQCLICTHLNPGHELSVHNHSPLKLTVQEAPSSLWFTERFASLNVGYCGEGHLKPGWAITVPDRFFLQTAYSLTTSTLRAMRFMYSLNSSAPYYMPAE